MLIIGRYLADRSCGVLDGQPALPAAGGLPGAGFDPPRGQPGAHILPPARLGQGTRTKDLGQRRLTGMNVS
jgi:hypothetical protein